MKQKLVATLFLFFSVHCAVAQNDNDDIQKTAASYFKLIEQNNMEASFDYIYPKLFEQFDKQKMLESLNAVLKDTAIILTMNNGRIKSISSTIMHKGLKYALVKYSFTIMLQFKGKETEELQFIHEMMKKKYDEKNLKYEKEQNTFVILQTTEMYAINDPAYSGWKFLEKKPGMEKVMELLLPAAVTKKL